MKLINNTAIVVCLFVSVSGVAQETSTKTQTQSNPSAMTKDSVQKSEDKKEEYKSKEWRQGIEIADTTSKFSKKRNLRLEKKSGKSVPPPPPPPPPSPPARPPSLKE